jgi:hypothetical protein
MLQKASNEVILEGTNGAFLGVALRRQWMMLGIPTNGWWLVTG